MKKILNKIKPRSKKKVDEPPLRITNETITEHRERILAGGRRFKYPVQYARHKLVFNTIIISIVTLIIIAVVGWWQLYPAQNTSTFIYRVTKVLPLPVAYVDDQAVRYSDYLMQYRSAAHYLEQKEQINLKAEDNSGQLEYIKQQAMSNAISDAYAAKLARSLDISVSDSELEAFLKIQRQSSGSDSEVSQQTYDTVILDYYGWTPDEYRHVMKNKLLRQKVAYRIDELASSQSTQLESILSDSSVQFQEVANDFDADNVTYGASGWVPKTNQDGGLASTASGLEKGKISEAIKSTAGDGYYFVRLLDINDTQVSYDYIHIELTEFLLHLGQLEEDGKIKRLIDVGEIVNS